MEGLGLRKDVSYTNQVTGKSNRRPGFQPLAARFGNRSCPPSLVMGESTTNSEAGGLNFLPAAIAAGKKTQKHFYASMLNLDRVRRTRFGQE
jgi:hypothetical protein